MTLRGHCKSLQLHGTIRKLWCGFLYFAFHSNGSILPHHYRDNY